MARDLKVSSTDYWVVSASTSFSACLSGRDHGSPRSRRNKRAAGRRPAGAAVRCQQGPSCTPESVRTSVPSIVTYLCERVQPAHLATQDFGFASGQGNL